MTTAVVAGHQLDVLMGHLARWSFGRRHGSLALLLALNVPAIRERNRARIALVHKGSRRTEGERGVGATRQALAPKGDPAPAAAALRFL